MSPYSLLKALKLVTSRFILLCTLSIPAIAGPIWEAGGGLSVQQIGGGSYDVSGGTKFWSTSVRITNNNPFAVEQAGFLTTSASLNANSATWNDANHNWSASGLTASVLAASNLPISMTTVTPPGTNGISSASSPAFRTVGTLAPGESVDVEWWDETSDGVGGYFFNGSFAYRRDAPTYRQISGISLQQTGLRTVDLIGGNKLWGTSVLFTNNTASALDLLFLLNSLAIDGTAGTWKDATRSFSNGVHSGRAVNPSSYLSLGRTNLGPSGPGMDANSALAAFAIGFLEPGQSISVEWWLETEDAVGGLFFNGSILAADEVPEPSALLLTAAGLVALALRGRQP